MTKPTRFFKWVVKLRMWYADITPDTMVRNGIMNLGDHYMGRKMNLEKDLKHLKKQIQMKIRYCTIKKVIIAPILWQDLKL